jgi:hypothetical protein
MSVMKNQNAISFSKYDLGTTNVVEHHIEVNGAKPFKQPAYRATLKDKKEIEKQIEDMQTNNIIKKTIAHGHRQSF